MRYANYRFNASAVNNLGDQMQIIAIDNIYRQMGINLKDVVYIDMQELGTYQGEYVVLPYTMPLVDYREGGLSGRFSPYIIPVFLGISMIKEKLLPEEIEYLRKYEPIGCRDELTLNLMRRYHISCYLHGCVTVTLPKREKEPVNPKVYIVDVNEKYLEQIPSDILKNAQFRTHMRNDILDDPKKEAIRQYKEYINNAGLVVTSLLHCSVPCMAAGIPVILLKEKVPYRMAWLEKLLPIYTEETIESIMWNPEPIGNMDHFKRVQEITIARLKDAYDRNAALCDLSWFYEERQKCDYINDSCESLKCFIDENWKDFQKEYRYSIWGLTQISEWLIDYIEEKYPHARLCHIYDTYRKVKLHGLSSEHPQKIVDFPMETVFVTMFGGELYAKKFFAEIGRPDGTFAIQRVMR